MLLILAVLTMGTSLTTDHIITSTYLNEERPFTVHVPEQKADAYPVLYVLDGRNRTEQALHITGYLTGRRKLPPMLVVSIPHTGQRSRDFLAYVDGQANAGAARFSKFLERELIPYIDAHYPTRPHRTLMGHSLSGAYVLFNRAHSDDVFQSHYAFSPSLHHTPKLIDDVVETLNGSSPKGYLYTNIGLQEFEPIVDRFQELKNRVAEHQADETRIRFQEFPDDGHATTPFIGLYSALKGQYVVWSPSLSRFKELAGQNRHLSYYKDLTKEFRYPVAPTYRDLESIWRYFYFRVDDPKTAAVAVELAKHFHPESVKTGDFHFVAFFEQHGVAQAYPETAPNPREGFLNGFGYAKLDKQMFDEAVYAFTLNTRLYPQSANAWDSLGEAYERKGDRREAKDCYQKAVDIATEQGDKQRDVFRRNLARLSGD